MVPRRYTILLTLATELMLIVLSHVIGTGCGSAPLDVDKAALSYTPESLAQELALRLPRSIPTPRKQKPITRPNRCRPRLWLHGSTMIRSRSKVNRQLPRSDRGRRPLTTCSPTSTIN